MIKIFKILFNNQTIDAWISVFGTFLGTLFAGVISAMIAVWTFKKQKLTEIVEEKNNKKKGIQLIDEFVNLAISSLLFLMPGKDNAEIPIFSMVAELKKLKETNKELDNIPQELIPIDINLQFQNIRILLKILEVEIEEILIQPNEFSNKYNDELKKVNIEGRLIKIVEHFKSFSETPCLDDLYNDLKKIERENKYLSQVKTSPGHRTITNDIV